MSPPTYPNKQGVSLLFPPLYLVLMVPVAIPADRYFFYHRLLHLLPPLIQLVLPLRTCILSFENFLVSGVGILFPPGNPVDVRSISSPPTPFDELRVFYLSSHLASFPLVFGFSIISLLPWLRSLHPHASFCRNFLSYSLF